ncbi:helix-turn-helix domain-containing protein [Kineosporia babensis]|uniref:Helix-turn-helix domain-containing protein n=1 Tax=Kineosporia babensis TaxID=499548 RepID=A0A9X1T0X0_9ACTN|nr:helix-turn-helix transcriptional regulator [Kineosporia babensis]MCD5313243.1 helix-turn-helix domain-containing protein [Kineosporia babensis]
MTTNTSAKDLGALLQQLKDRDGRSYSALAHRAGTSRSSLHRYCQGQCVPETFGTVEQLARLCGATQEELAELHRLWSLATRPVDPCGAVARVPAARVSSEQQTVEPQRLMLRASTLTPILLAFLIVLLVLIAIEIAEDSGDLFTISAETTDPGQQASQPTR